MCGALASSVYWMGLATWGIRVFPGAQDQYQRSLDLYYARQSGRRARSSEFDGESQTDPGVLNWHAGLPPMPSGFPQGAEFALSRLEAVYLRERVLTSCPRSLLAHILRERLSLEDVSECWDLAESVPPTLREQLEHGRSFSEIMLGAQLLYNLMLAQLRPWPEKVEEYRALLAKWREQIADRKAELASWDRTRFWQIVRMANPRVSLRAQGFINQWIDLALRSTNGDGIAKDQAARDLVDQRESALKRGQSRLHHRRALELWNGAAGAGQMDLRWGAAQRILSDILDGLEAADDA